MWELSDYLRLMAKQKASDCFFSAGAPPSIKIEGKTVHIGDLALPTHAPIWRCVPK
jgi:twitching motility protein PilU